MEIRDIAPRVWAELDEIRALRSDIQGLTVRIHPQDWQDLRIEARSILRKSTSIPIVEGDTIFGVPVVPDFWVPVGKIFICREVQA